MANTDKPIPSMTSELHTTVEAVLDECHRIAKQQSVAEKMRGSAQGYTACGHISKEIQKLKTELLGN